jgi:hypothetical protein
MGPLFNAEQARKDLEAGQKRQREMMKALNDERRKGELHSVKLAKEIAGAQSKGIDITSVLPKVIKGGPLAAGAAQVPNAAGQGTTRVPNSAPAYNGPTPTNPEAGPSDRKLAAVAPGEAIIPAPAAQSPLFKDTIEMLVQKGREMLGQQPTPSTLGSGGAARAGQQIQNRSQRINAAVDGMESGTTKVERKTETEEERKKRLAAEELARKAAEQAKAPAPTIQGAADAIRRRREALMGLQSGTTGLTHEQMQQRESSGNPKAQNPASTAYGLAQITDPQYEEIVKHYPELAGRDKNDPEIMAASDRVYASQLRAKGIEVNNDTIRKAHVVGAGGLNILLTADPEAQLEQVLPKDFYVTKGVDDPRKNPNLRGKTVAEFLADPDPYTRKQPSRGPLSAPSRRPTAADLKKVDAPGYESQNRIAALQGRIKAAQPYVDGSQGSYAAATAQRDIGQYEAERAKEIDASSGQPLPYVPPVGREATTTTDQPARNSEMARTDAAIAAENFVPNEPFDESKFRIETEKKKPMWEDPKAVEDYLGIGKTPEPENAAFFKSMQEELVNMPVEDQRTALEKGIAQLYGPKGIFNDRDLIKFAVLAAGGLLTGGSVRGSLRYAGMAVMKDSDQRWRDEVQAQTQETANQNIEARQEKRDLAMAERQARAAIATELRQHKLLSERERAQRLRDAEKEAGDAWDNFNKYSATATPAARTAAFELYEQAMKTSDPLARATYMRHATTLLTTDQVHTGGSTPEGKTYRAPDGRRVYGIPSKDGKTVEVLQPTRDASGKVVGQESVQVPVSSLRPEADVQKERQTLITRVEKEVGGVLESNVYADPTGNKATKDSSMIKAEATALAHFVVPLMEELGGDDPELAAHSISRAITSLTQQGAWRERGGMGQDAVRRMVFGQLVFDSRKGSQALYSADGKPPVPKYLLSYGAQLEKYRDLYTARGQMPPNAGQMAKKLEEMYIKLPEAQKRKLEAEASSEKTTGFLIWMSKNPSID